MIGGAVGIIGHLEIVDNVTITAMSLVTRSIGQSGCYSSGIPVDESSKWNKSMARVRQLDMLAKRIKELEKEK